jgi:hypothetical protein
MEIVPSSPSTMTSNERRFSRKEQAIEVGVFLSLIVPSMVLSLFVIRQGKLGFVITAISIIARDLAPVACELRCSRRGSLTNQCVRACGPQRNFIALPVPRNWQHHLEKTTGLPSNLFMRDSHPRNQTGSRIIDLQSVAD